MGGGAMNGMEKFYDQTVIAVEQILKRLEKVENEIEICRRVNELLAKRSA